MSNRFAEDLQGEPPFEYNHAEEMAARGVPFCQYCHEEMCLSQYFHIDFLQEWRTHSEKDMVLGDGSEPPLSNSLIRKYLYRQFLIHSKWRPLEKKKRVVLPKCATTLIRDAYPGEQNAYIGHRWKASTGEKTYAVDANGDELRNMFWVHENDAWVLKGKED